MTATARALAALLALAPAACPADEDGDPGAGGGDCRIAVISSDYVSASLSLLDERGARCADNVLHSGSRPPSIVTALSGDVVLPATLHPDGLITLIDRYPNGVLTWFDAAAGRVVAQLSVATGFAANPQDVAYVSTTKAYVSRAETNEAPSADPGDHDDGGDLLIIDPSAPAITGRIDLQAEATDAGDPRPSRMALAGGLVWIGLENLSRDKDRGGPGVLVAVDPARDAVVQRLELGDYANCGRAVAATAAGDGLWVGCNGVFQDGAAAQLARSALLFIDLTGPAPTVGAAHRAADLGGQPLGFTVAPLDGERVAFVVFGDLAADSPDRLLLMDGPGGAVETLLESDAFQLGGLLWLAAERLLLVAEADPQAPRIRRFELPEGAAPRELPAVDATFGVGLPPRGLATFR